MAVGLLLVLSIASYEYLQVASLSSHSASATTSIATGGSQSQSNTSIQVLSSPCAQKLPSQSAKNKLYPNGTNVLTITYPVFALSPGAVGTLCVAYPNNTNASYVSDLTYAVGSWKNSTMPSGFKFLLNPDTLPAGPGNRAIAVYALQASTSVTGYYMLVMSHYTTCGAYPLVVSKDASIASFSDFPGLIDFLLGTDRINCTWWAPPGDLLGFNGFSTVDLTNASKTQAIYNETSRAVVSIIESPKVQNITFTLGIQSFRYPLILTYGTGYSPTTLDFSVFPRKTNVTPTPGDACDWELVNVPGASNSSIYAGEIPTADVVLNAPTLKLQPFSQGVFKYSVLVSNLPPGYFYTFFPHVIVEWNNNPHNQTDLSLGQWFPLNAGSGQWDQNISGTCPTH